MRERILITDPVVRRLPAPAERECHVWDSRLRGFGVRVSAAGSRTFVVLVASGRTKVIGKYPLVTLQEARGEATRILAEKALGKVQPKRMAFDDATKEFLAEQRIRNRDRTVRDYVRHFKLHYPFGRTSVGDIRPHDILRHLNKLIAVPSERHHAYAAGRKFFNWCVHQHLLDRSPMENFDIKPTNRSRERVLTDEELGRTLELALAGDTHFHRIVALLILTGQRRGEISALRWTWLGQDSITIPSAIAKNSREHKFPIGNKAQEFIATIPHFDGSPYLFPAAKNRFKDVQATIFNSFGAAKADLDKQLRIAPWTIHDLRRTFRTRWAELGILREVAEKYINHISGIHSGIEGVYNRAAYAQPMREAVQRWEAHLEMLLATAKGC